MATQQLINAVRFSTDGGDDFKNGIKALETLVYKVDLATQRQFAEKERQFSEKKLLIFGQKDHRLFESMEKGETLVEFGDDKTDSSTRQIISQLGDYTTLLERLMACRKCSGEKVLEAVFRRCCENIENYYNEAVDRKRRGSPELDESEIERETYIGTQNLRTMSFDHNVSAHIADEVYTLSEAERVSYFHAQLPAEPRYLNPHLEDKFEVKSVYDDLQQIIDKFDDHKEVKDIRITDDDCAILARCIIVAWTYLVRVVQWDDDTVEGGDKKVEHATEVKSGTHRIKNGTKSVEVFWPQPLLKLPDISAWE